MTLFRPYRLPAQNDEGVPLVGDDFGTADPGANIGYGQNNDDSDEDYSAANLYGPPAAQAPPVPPSPNAGMTGAAASQQATPPPPVASDAPPPPVQPAQSPYAVKVQQAINNRADMQRPELPKPSIWRQIAGALAGTALGAIGGQRKEAQQQGEDLKNAIDYGPTALRQQAQYNQKVADADAQLGAIGKGEDILTRGDERLTNADTRKTNASIRDAQQKSSQQAAINSAMDRQITAAQKAAELGGVRVAADAPQTPNTTRVIDPMDFDPTTGQLRNKTALDVPVKLGPIPVNDPGIAKELGVPAGTMVDPKQYFDAVGKIIETTHKPPTEAVQKDEQIKADLASSLGVPPESINDAQMNAGRRMFGSGQPLTTSMMRNFVATNKRLPTAQEEQALNLKAEQTLHPHQANDASAVAALDRESKQFDSPWSKMATDAGSQLDKIADARNQLSVGNAEAQALAVPKVMTALISGQGSGVRITQPELQAIARARGLGGDIEGTLRSWAGQGKLTPTQVQQLMGALDDAAKRISQKQAIANEALDNIHSAAKREDIIQADQIARHKMTQYENPGMVSVQIPGHPPGMIPAANVAAFKAAHPDATVQQ